MCVPVPPSTGTAKAAGASPVGSTTQPTSIDYSRYAGVSPFDVRSSNPNGLPANWDWNEWMKVNPGAPDPTTHTNTGMVITPQNAALWNQHATPAVAPPLPTNPAARTNNTSAPPPAPVVMPPNPSGTVAVTTQPLQVSGPTGTDPNAATQPSGLPAGNSTYSGTAPTAYGPGSTLGDTPTTRVSNAMARRFKPEGWY